MRKLFVLVLFMATLLSVTVFCAAAETPQICVSGVEITAENAADILGDGSVVYDAATGTLTLTDADITAENLPYGIYAEGDLTIHLVGENTLTVSGEAPDCKELTGIFVGGKLTVTGDGSLYVSVSGNPAETVYGIHTGDLTQLFCSYLSVCVEETTAATAYGIKVDNSGMLLDMAERYYICVEGAAEYTCGMDVNGNIVSYSDVYVTDGYAWTENGCGVHADMIYIIDCWFESFFRTAFVADMGIEPSDGIYVWGQAEAFTSGTPVTLTKHENSWSYVTFGWHEYDVGVGDVEVTSLNKHDVLGDGTVSYDNKTYTLTLNNAHIEGSIDAYEGVNIILKGENTITSIVPDHEHAIYGSGISMLSGSGSIYGPGSLDIYLYGNNTQELYAIYLAGNNTIRDCEINITVAGENNYDAKGIMNAGAPLTIESSKINVDMSGCDGNETGIWNYQGLSAYYSNISVLGADKAYEVSDGVITVGYNLAVSGSKESFINGALGTLTPENPNEPVVIAPYQPPTSGTCGENLTWTLDEAGTLTISGTGDMVADEAWFNNTDIKSVVMEDGVTSICEFAFYGCSRMESVEIPGSVKTIGNSAFENCSSLKNVVIPEGVTHISAEAFFGSGVEEVTIPDSVVFIGDAAFNSCRSLKEVHLSRNVKHIGSVAFSHCTGLTGIWVDENNPNYCSDEYGMLYSKDKTCLIQAPGAYAGSYTIPQGVAEIDDQAFANCDKLTNVVFPQGMTYIGDRAFANCDQLTAVILPDTLTKMGVGAFEYCECLTTVILPDSLTVIPEAAFRECPYLENVTLGNAVTEIGEYAFYYSYGLKSILLPESLEKVGDQAFFGNFRLNEVFFRDTEAQVSQINMGSCCFNTVEQTWHYQVTEEVVDGTTLYRCGSCSCLFYPDGTLYWQYVQPVLNTDGFSLSFEDMVQVNFYYTVEHTENIEEQGMLVFYADPGEADIAKADEVQKAQYVASSDKYMASSYGIAAKEMGDDHYYCAYAKLTDGSYVYSTPFSYSPREYAMNRVKYSPEIRMKALCVAMLNYGAAAQEYFGYRTDDLMNKDLTDEQQALVRAYDPSLFTGAVAADSPLMKEYASTGTGFSRRGSTVSFRGNIAINYYLTPTEEVQGTMLFYGFRSRDLTTPGITIATSMEPLENGSYYQCFDIIAPKELDDTVYVVAMYYDTDGNYHCTGLIPYSISQYCMNTANSPTMGNLSQATAMYGYYAKEYFCK